MLTVHEKFLEDLVQMVDAEMYSYFYEGDGVLSIDADSHEITVHIFIDNDESKPSAECFTTYKETDREANHRTIKSIKSIKSYIERFFTD